MSAAAPLLLTADRSSLTLAGGGSTGITYKATGATADIMLNLSGAPAGINLSASQITLSAANQWAATVTLASAEDRDATGNKAFTLQASSSVAPPVGIAATLLDNDSAPATVGRASGSYITTPGANNTTLAALSTDNVGTSTTGVLTLREGMTGAGAGIDYRWQFTNLAPGDKLLQVDA